MPLEVGSSQMINYIIRPSEEWISLHSNNSVEETSPTFLMARDLSGKQCDHPAGKVLTIKQATPCTTVKRQKLQKSMSRLEALVEAKTQGANSMIHWSWGGYYVDHKERISWKNSKRWASLQDSSVKLINILLSFTNVFWYVLGISRLVRNLFKPQARKIFWLWQSPETPCQQFPNVHESCVFQNTPILWDGSPSRSGRWSNSTVTESSNFVS